MVGRALSIGLIDLPFSHRTHVTFKHGHTHPGCFMCDGLSALPPPLSPSFSPRPRKLDTPNAAIPVRVEREQRDLGVQDLSRVRAELFLSESSHPRAPLAASLLAYGRLTWLFGA
jgi:hypothetical protein